MKIVTRVIDSHAPFSMADSLISFIHSWSSIAFHAFHISFIVFSLVATCSNTQHAAAGQSHAQGRRGGRRQETDASGEPTAEATASRESRKNRTSQHAFTTHHAASGSKASLGRCKVAMRPATGPTVPFSGECALLRQN